MEVQFVEVDRIVEDPDQPRQAHDEDSLAGLADSLRQYGMIQPITVVELASVNMYRIVTGERRWRAARMAGLDLVPCVVKTAPPEDALTEQLIENMQREDLQPLEKARALRHIKESLGATNREIAGRLGISERSVGGLLDLLDLPESIARDVTSSPNRPADGRLTEKHARYIRQLNDQPGLQAAVVDKIRDEKITSEYTAGLVKALRRRPDQADQILQSPADHLVTFFRDSPPDSAVVDDPADTSPPSVSARLIVEFLPLLDGIQPADIPHPHLRQIEDALISLKLAVDGLLRECRLELGETEKQGSR